MDLAGGNPVAGKRRLGQRIDDRRSDVGEIAGPLLRVRKDAGGGEGFALPQPFPGEQPEQAVLDYRATGGSAVLIALERRDGLGGLIEEVLRIEGGVAEEFIE